MSTNKAKSEQTPMKIIGFIIKSPITILCKIRDLYVRCITNCTGRISYGGAMACSTAPSSNLPRNFSANSSTADEDLRELIRAVSQKAQIQKLQQQIKQQKEGEHSSDKDQNKNSIGGGGGGGGGGGLAKSVTVSTGGVLNIETIDENVSCHFDAEVRG